MPINKIVDSTGFIVAGISGIFSLLLFYRNTDSFWGSLGAAIIAAGLIWLSYVIMRLLVLALKK